MNHIKVCVTGASGLVGLHLVKLLLDRQHQVVCCVRKTSNRDALLSLINSKPGLARIVTVDISQPNNLAELMADCDATVHTAASIEIHGRTEEMRKVNVDGTRSVLDAAIAAGVKHFIHISSLSVITGEEDKYAVSEGAHLAYCREAYANSKIDAEKIVMNECNRGRIEVTSLRPGFIYGPNERSWMPRLVKAIKSGTAMLVGNGEKQTNVIFVENLCYAIELAMLNDNAYGQVYNLTDGQVVTKRELLDTVCDELHLPRVRLRIPVFLARLLVESATFLAPMAPTYLTGLLNQFSRPAFRLFAINQGFDISKAERELNYVHRIPFAEGMAKSLRPWKEVPSRPVKDSSFTPSEEYGISTS
jgi:nucleoside-diphosphate-sugar epimerase